MAADSVRVSVYLPAVAEQAARRLAKEQGITRNAVFRRALELLQVYEESRKIGHYVGTARAREALDQVILAPF